jgi:hypothetical protein
MPEYNNGRVYRIVSPSCPEIPSYYGSTIRTLSQRMVQHRSKSNTTCSRLLIDCGDAIIILVEEVICKSKEELRKKEAEYILGNECINKTIPSRTKREYYEANKEKWVASFKKRYEEKKEEIKQYQRDFYHEHKNDEEFLKKRKEYQEKHTEDKKEYDKEYRTLNKEKKLKNDKAYYEANKEKSLQKHKCECGGRYAIMHKKKHEQTQKHQDYIKK